MVGEESIKVSKAYIMVVKLSYINFKKLKKYEFIVMKWIPIILSSQQLLLSWEYSSTVLTIFLLSSPTTSLHDFYMLLFVISWLWCTDHLYIGSGVYLWQSKSFLKVFWLGCEKKSYFFSVDRCHEIWNPGIAGNYSAA